ncbi:hypothetical protein EJB05_28740, partial [Eragrostis curvula]
MPLFQPSLTLMMISSAPFCRCRRRPVGILNVATSSLPLLCRAGETEVAGSSRHWEFSQLYNVRDMHPRQRAGF